MSTLTKSIEFLEPIITKWKFNEKPLVISISGPQGSGKSYLSSKLAIHLTRSYPTLNSITISTDDLYLRNKDQRQLTKDHPGTKLLNGRGLPGTHDVELGYNLISKIVNKESGFKIPTYNKAAFNGEGDRNDEDQWQNIKTPIDILIVEGWFNGFLPFENSDDVEEIINSSKLLSNFPKDDIFEINSFLDEYVKIWNFFDVDIFFDTEDINNVFEWRIQQEHELIEQKGSGMTDQQVRDFISRYMAVYKLYYRDFTLKGTPSTPKGYNLKIKLDSKRVIENVEIF
ncbi:putative kinase [Wickerhamomyces ciferrii]|uniref:Kinase n=1 Tax=Wickerhamomyces ciferrii (strain ATCC 14091 / BCRC 22168 / CBS 111 / JCM 3599 / NBRC 0793 / NRRL Y-1031 F-60-10) TaxID=1206466 RepID=K0KMS8_WICCF|nr:putative kinase [Wickerhamomyces ciferrii]CCH42669.1 putative kinase [Wickerhamomyces ciferrii]